MSAPCFAPFLRRKLDLDKVPRGHSEVSLRFTSRTSDTDGLSELFTRACACIVWWLFEKRKLVVCCITVHFCEKNCAILSDDDYAFRYVSVLVMCPIQHVKYKYSSTKWVTLWFREFWRPCFGLSANCFLYFEIWRSRIYYGVFKLFSFAECLFMEEKNAFCT